MNKLPRDEMLSETEGLSLESRQVHHFDGPTTYDGLFVKRLAELQSALSEALAESDVLELESLPSISVTDEMVTAGVELFLKWEESDEYSLPRLILQLYLRMEEVRLKALTQLSK